MPTRGSRLTTTKRFYCRKNSSAKNLTNALSCKCKRTWLCGASAASATPFRMRNIIIIFIRWKTRLCRLSSRPAFHLSSARRINLTNIQNGFLMRRYCSIRTAFSAEPTAKTIWFPLLKRFLFQIFLQCATFCVPSFTLRQAGRPATATFFLTFRHAIPLIGRSLPNTLSPLQKALTSRQKKILLCRM